MMGLIRSSARLAAGDWRLHFAPSGLDGLLGFSQRRVEAEELLDPSGLQGIEDTVVYADQGQRAPVFAVIDVSADEGADAGRVDVADRGEIDDEDARLLGAKRRLELEKCSEHNGALQA